MSDHIPELSKTEITNVRRAALNSRYHLLLGAGASVESKSKDGRTLPLGVALSAELVDAFNLPFDDGDALPVVFARALDLVGKGELDQFLIRRFADVTPPYWMKYYAAGRWACVWTLNLDCSFEIAYQLVRIPASQAFRSITGFDAYSRTTSLEVVHLHGRVTKDEVKDVVFSIPQYHTAIQSRSAWPTMLEDQYGVEPFVIVGAKALDEPDIGAMIERHIPHPPAPSFYVSPHISSARESDLIRCGLTPVQATAEDFLIYWEEWTGLPLKHPPVARDEYLARLFVQFSELTKTGPMTTPVGHDFLGGSQPMWSDALTGNIGVLTWVQQAMDTARHFSGGDASLQLLLGGRLTGRSAALLAVGHQLLQDGWRVFKWRDDNRLDCDAILSVAASPGRQLALLFDGISPRAEQINKLLKDARAAGLKLYIVAVDSRSASLTLTSRLEPSVLVGGQAQIVPEHINGRDADAMVRLLDSKGRLGLLQELPSDRRRKHFQGNFLFDAMASVEYAPGFRDRVDMIFSGPGDSTEDVLTLLLLTGLAYDAEAPLTVIDAAAMLSIKSDSLIRLIKTDERANTMIQLDDNWLRPRQRTMITQGAIRKLTPKVALDQLALAMRRISARLTHEASSQANSTSFLVSRLMQYKFLRSRFANQDIDGWYDSMQGSFGTWSGRYWEQRAILCRDEHLAKGLGYALRATDLLRDAFSYTTLGTVLVQRATEVDIERARDFYLRGCQAFDDADSFSRKSAVTTTAYLDYALALIEHLSQDGSPEALKFRDDVARDWSNSFLIAVQSHYVDPAAFDMLLESRLRFNRALGIDDLGASNLKPSRHIEQRAGNQDWQTMSFDIDDIIASRVS